MPLFRYTAVLANGSKKKNTRQADSADALRKVLRSEGQFVVDVKEVQKSASGTRRRSFLPRGSGGLAAFTQELAVLLGAQLPLEEALEALTDSLSDDAQREVAMDLREKLQGGTGLADGLDAHPEFFPEVYRTLVRVGEANGALVEVLRRLAVSLERQRDLERRLQGASAYPAFVLLMIIGVLVGLMVFIVPTVERLIVASDLPMPWPTRLLLGLDAFLSNGGWFAIMGLAAGLVAFVSWFRRSRREEWDRLLLGTPGLGSMVLVAETARFTGALSVLLQGKTPLASALERAAGTVTNTLLRERVEKITLEVGEGRSVGQAFLDDGTFPAFLGRILRLGERSGEVERLCNHAAEHFEQLLIGRLEAMVGLMQPLLTVILAVIVGFVAVAVFLPLLELSGSL